MLVCMYMFLERNTCMHGYLCLERNACIHMYPCTERNTCIHGYLLAFVQGYMYIHMFQG